MMGLYYFIMKYILLYTYMRARRSLKLLCNVSQRTGVWVLIPQLLTSPYAIRFRSVGNVLHWESRLTIRDTSLDSVHVNTWELMFRSQN
jgi:hypothetical protein